MEIFLLVVLFHLIVTAACQLGVLQKCYLMFSSKMLRTTTTPLFLCFFIYLAITSLTSLAYCVYALAFWRPDVIPHNQNILYLIGVFPWLLLISNPVFQFCLCIERCFIVSFPYKYLDQWQKSMCYLSVAGFALVVCSLIYFGNFIWLPGITGPLCGYFSCVISVLPTPYINNYKTTIAVLELISDAILCVLMRKKITNKQAKKGRKKDLVTLVVSLSTVVCEIIPNIADEICIAWTGQQPVRIIGPYRTTLSSCNIFIAAFLYSHVFRKSRSDKTSTVQVIPSSSMRVTTIPRTVSQFNN